MITRRSFVTGLATLIAAPAIVRVDSLMRLRSTPIVVDFDILHPLASAMLNIEKIKGMITSAYAVPPEFFYSAEQWPPVRFSGFRQLLLPEFGVLSYEGSSS
jgi:hypothetical protein